jgi:hypothetical protein
MKIPHLADAPDHARIATEQARDHSDHVYVSEKIAGENLVLDFDDYIQDCDDPVIDAFYEHPAVKAVIEGHTIHAVMADTEHYNLASSLGGYRSPLFIVTVQDAQGTIITHDAMRELLDDAVRDGVCHFLPTVWIGAGYLHAACSVEKAKKLLVRGQIGGDPVGLVWRVDRYPSPQIEPGRQPYTDFFVQEAV